MSTRRIVPELVGVDRFCPTCGRWLVRVHPGGTFDLAGKASVVWLGELDVDEGRGQLVDGEATCWRWRCRLRRLVRP